MTGAVPDTDTLVGMWFHSLTPAGDPNWQGHILARAADEHYLVELYSWLTGEPNGRKLVTVSEMRCWRLFETNQEMLDAGDAWLAQRRGVA